MLTCLLVSRASVTCLLGVELGVEDYFLVSRASVTCLLAVVEELFAVVNGVGDVLAGRGAGC